jgi:hypothetical protein
MIEETVTTTTTTTVRRSMTTMRRKLKLPPIKRNWIKRSKAKGMTMDEYVVIFCKLNNLTT